MSTRIVQVVIVVASIVAGAVAGSATGASAAIKQESAMFCVPDSSVGNAGTSFFSDDGVRNTNTSNTLTLFCPIHDGDSFRHDAITYSTVDVYDGRTDAHVSVSDCVSLYDGSGHQCSTNVSTTDAQTGHQFITLGRGTWTNASYTASYPYVYVLLPAQSGANWSSFIGTYMNN